MTDTTTRPLPTDWATLKAYMPAEPESSATRLRAAIASIDAITTSVRAELDQATERERAVANEVFSAANAGGDIAAILAAWRPARAHIEQRLAVLAGARSIGAHKLAHAEATDPLLLGWRARCAAITTEWQNCMATEIPERRFEQLARFAEAHRPTGG